MELSDFGIDRSGVHDRTLTRVEAEFIGILMDHQGQGNTVSADALAYCLGCALSGREVPWLDDREAWGKAERKYNRQALELQKREVRHLQNHLLELHDHLPVYSKAGPGGGYYLGETEDEAEEFMEHSGPGL